MLTTLVETLRQVGFFDFYLPFLLTFAIFYGLLTKAKPFGETATAQRINLVIALVAAFYVMTFTPVGITLAQFFANFFGGVSVVLLTLLVLGGMFWMGVRVVQKEEEAKEKMKYIYLAVGALGGVLLLAVFVWAGGLVLFGVATPYYPVVDVETLIFILVLVAAGLGLWWVMKGKEEA